MKTALYILFLFLILIGFGYFRVFKSLDPDFGWHLKTGELILERGVPKTDWYSFTMPDFPWIDHAWLTDVFIYKFHSIFGYNTLLLFFLALAALSFIIQINSKRIFFYLPPVILGFWAILGFLGARTQIITLFFISLLWRILNRFWKNPDFFQQKVFYLPLLFFIWANLHGGFFAGLLILFLVVVLEAFKKTGLFSKLISLPFFRGQNYFTSSSSQIFILFIFLVFSFLATLINPYGLRIYEEIIFRTSGDNFLRFHIVEWLPLLFASPSIFIILYLGLFLGLLIPLRKKIEFSQLVIGLIFLVLAFLNQRHFPLFVILSLPILAEFLFHFRQQIIPERLKILLTGFKKWLIVFVFLAILVYGFYPTVNYFLKNTADYYPEKALSFLKTLPLSDNLFNEYSWGGYLIWKIPERKIFIDGRMPSWRQNNQFVFGDYVKIMKGEEGFEKLLDKYEIKIALLKNEKRKNFKKEENKIANFLKKQTRLLKILGLEPKKNLVEELINLNWQVIYEDQTAIILKK